MSTAAAKTMKNRNDLNGPTNRQKKTTMKMYKKQSASRADSLKNKALNECMNENMNESYKYR